MIVTHPLMLYIDLTGSGTWTAGLFALPGTVHQGKDMNYTYILHCADGTLYCGWTNDLKKRLHAHNSGTGAKYTKSRRPVTLAYYEAFETKQEAMKREYAIKQLPRKKKEELISHGCNMDLCMVAEDQVYATN